MKKIRAVIVGLGRIASLLEDDKRREKPCTHAGAIAANPDCGLAGGCDTVEERRQLFSERWKVPVYSDAAEMILEQKPQILVVATHPDSHYHYCSLAASSGVPVIVCEKPLANSLSAAKKIAALGAHRRQGRTEGKQGRTEGRQSRTAVQLPAPVILTNHERRYSADYIKAKEILIGGKLGKILSVRAVLYMSENQRLLDVLWHDGTHLADAIMFLTGSILKHRRRWGAKLKGSSGTAWLEGELIKSPASPNRDPGNQPENKTPDHKTPDHKNLTPIPVLIEAGAGRDHLVFEMEFSCAKGRLRIGNGIFEVWESVESPYAEKFRSLKLSDEIFKGPTAYFSNMIADAVACACEPGRQPVSSAEDGLGVIEYLDSVNSWI